MMMDADFRFISNFPVLLFAFFMAFIPKCSHDKSLLADQHNRATTKNNFFFVFYRLPKTNARVKSECEALRTHL